MRGFLFKDLIWGLLEALWEAVNALSLCVDLPVAFV